MYRIFHCGKSLENYDLCIEQKVVGYKQRIAKVGERLYIAVNTGKESLCGARVTLSELTDFTPWNDGANYVQCFYLSDIEYCEPFPLKILASLDKKWGSRYLLGGAPVTDQEHLRLLDKVFNENRIDKFKKMGIEKIPEESTDIQIDPSEQVAPQPQLDISSTYVAVSFPSGEEDEINGLETLVTQNFYHLFEDLSENRTVLISENRAFGTSRRIGKNKESVTGVSGIPDAVLKKFSKNESSCLQVYLIEYECYGEKKSKPT